jgi:hypothetical protein
MAYKMYAAFIASFSVALTLVSNETFGGSWAGQERNIPALGPAAGGFFYGLGNGERSISGDIRFRNTYEPLWDAVHQYPEVIRRSETVPEPVVRTIVPGCSAQTVTVPDSKETISIVRC